MPDYGVRLGLARRRLHCGDDHGVAAWRSTAVGELPVGWTLERAAQVAGCPVSLVPLDTEVFDEGPDGLRDRVEADLIIGCCDLYLVRETATGDYLMGAGDSDGAVICWASYGPDLEQALLGL
jgi:hypothetical protein